jgi:type II secretory pathway component PulC
VPLTIETRRLSRATREELHDGAGLTRSRLLPVERDGRTVGLQLFGVAAGGALHEAGARSGDLLLAVNGVELGESRWPSLEPFPGDTRALVVELERSGEHRILVLRW